MIPLSIVQEYQFQGKVKQEKPSIFLDLKSLYLRIISGYGPREVEKGGTREIYV